MVKMGHRLAIKSVIKLRKTVQKLTGIVMTLKKTIETNQTNIHDMQSQQRQLLKTVNELKYVYCLFTRSAVEAGEAGKAEGMGHTNNNVGQICDNGNVRLPPPSPLSQCLEHNTQDHNVNEHRTQIIPCAPTA